MEANLTYLFYSLKNGVNHLRKSRSRSAAASRPQAITTTESTSMATAPSPTPPTTSTYPSRETEPTMASTS